MRYITSLECEIALQDRTNSEMLVKTASRYVERQDQKWQTELAMFTKARHVQTLTQEELD
jgi:hypothetical protein